MNETTTRLLIFSAGCLAGLATSFAILKRRFDTLLAEEVSEEKKSCEEATEMLRKELDRFTNSEEKKPKPFSQLAESLSVPFKELAKELGVEEDTIYPITADEYGEQGYEQERLYYYAADETLTDKDDSVMDPDDSNVGEDAIDIFIYTDTETCYIRNNETKTDYEIIKVDGSYASYESEGLYE